MRDFWLASGHHLLDRDAEGRLVVTDGFLKAYLARPELLPPPEACEAERRLHHELLMHHPRRPVSAADIAALADPDARENWQFMIAFRDRLLDAPSLESAYVTLARSDSASLPPLFLQQLTQVVLRNALDGEVDPLVLRAGELFFRPQRVTFHEGSVLLADAETIDMHERDRHASPLLAMLGGPAVTALDILNADGAEAYFQRSDAFDMVLDISSAGGRGAIARAIEVWIRHLLAVRVTVEPVERMEDEAWAWFIGLDAEATQIGNALWKGVDPGPAALDRVLALFRLAFDDQHEVVPEVGARPVWLIMAMTPERILRMKPQNLVAGLPLRSNAPAN